MTSASALPGRLLSRLERRVRALFHELAKFGTVGFLSFMVDLAVFNAVLAVLDKPLTAKVISTVVAATNAFVLNRHWSFKHRERSTLRREYSLFFVLNAIGLGISLLCLATSHYVLGFESRLADNLAANGVGLVLGTTFRFWSYRRFVWLAPTTGTSLVEGAAYDGDAAAHAALEVEAELADPATAAHAHPAAVEPAAVEPAGPAAPAEVGVERTR